MRISVFKDDPGHQAWLAGLAPRRCVVTLDGVEQPLVQTADEEEGFVLRNILTNPSDPLSFKIVNDEWALERVEGVVKIAFVDGSGAPEPSVTHRFRRA
jgi:hypothetical protein